MPNEEGNDKPNDERSRTCLVTLDDERARLETTRQQRSLPTKTNAIDGVPATTGSETPSTEKRYARRTPEQKAASKARMDRLMKQLAQGISEENKELELDRKNDPT